MTFGKRGAGRDNAGPSPIPPEFDQDDSDAVLNVRARVATRGGADRAFIALAIGVIVVSAGAAIAVPAVFDTFSNPPLRPIKEVVAGLNETQAKVALHREAFPDGEGRAFMTTLQANFPQDHDRLLTRLANEAMHGGSRRDLMDELTQWSVEFVPANVSAIGRTGSQGFDDMLDIASGALDLVEETSGCTADKIAAFAAKPAKLAKTWEYGSDGYKFGMKASTMMVKLAAKGRNAPPAPTDLRREDEEALAMAAFGFMMDEQVMTLMRSAGGSNFPGDADAINRIDICKLGDAIIYKLRRMPFGTKDRLLGMAAQGFDRMPADLVKTLMSSNGIPGVNAPPSGFPMHMLEGPTAQDLGAPADW